MTHPTLHTRLEEYFSGLARPHTGRLFLEEYRALYRGASEFLAKPYPQAVTGQAIFNLLGQFPIGRILSPMDVGIYDESSRQRLPLSDSVCHWLVEFRHDTAMLSGALLARTLAPAELREDSAAFARKLSARISEQNREIAFDYAGIVRVGILLAAHFGEPMVTARSLGRAVLLLLDRDTWQLVRDLLRERSASWDALQGTYRVIRDSVLQADPLAHDRLLSAALFPRDQLVPLPESLRFEELQFLGQGLGFAWPGRRVEMGYGPLESAPEAVTDASILTHVLLPGLQRHGIVIPAALADHISESLVAAVGKTPAAGGWASVAARVIERYGFGPVIVTAGYNTQDVLDWACGMQATLPPSAANSSSPPGSQPCEESEYRQLSSKLISAGFGAHRDAVRQLALLVDPRAKDLGPARVLMIGPSGCGKTTLLDAFARATGRPLVKLDASSIVEHGWQGTTPSDVAARIYAAAGRDLTQAARAVLVLDEFCKTAARPHMPGAEFQGGNGTWETIKLSRQAALLGLLDTGPSTIAFTAHPGSELLELPVRDLIVVAAGAFSGLDYRRSQSVSDDSLIRYGLRPELAARFTTRLVLSALDQGSLRQRLIESPDGVEPIIAIASRFGVELVVSEEAIRLVLSATASGAGGLSPRTGAAVLTTAARRALLTALDEEEGTRPSALVGPDDVIGLLRPWLEQVRH